MLDRLDIIRAIKDKPELASLDDSFVQKKVEEYLQGHPEVREKRESSRDFAQFQRSREYKGLLKNVRRELREIYGVFRLDDCNPDDDPEKILGSHTSTRERLPFYDIIYKELSSRIPAPKTLLDLGCGMNPLSYSWMKRHGWSPEIIASDVSSGDMEFLMEAFQAHGIPGRTIALDLIKDCEILENIDADVTFMLKLLDSLETVERFISYKIFEHIASRWIVVSFPTKSLGGKKTIPAKGRSWFERLLKRFGYGFETFSVENEMFYVVRAFRQV